MNDVTYWILMLLLTAGCAGLLAGSFASVKRRNAQRAALRRRGRRPRKRTGRTGTGSGRERRTRTGAGTAGRRSGEKEEKTMEDYSRRY